MLRPPLDSETSTSFPDLARLVDALPGMVYTADTLPGWPMKWTSSGCLDLTGYTRKELTANGGTLFNELTLDHDRISVLDAIQASLEKHDSYEVEYRLCTRQGETKWVWEKGRAACDDSGRITGIEGFISDITSRKLMQHSLQTAEQRLQDIFENAAEGIFQSQPDGRYLDVNRSLARTYGYASPEAMMASLTDIQQQLYVDPERRREFMEVLDRRDRVWNFESEIRQANGGTVWISENARAVRDAGGNLLYYEGTVTDITARKAAQEQLANERTVLRTVVDAWPDIIYVKDTAGRYILSNRAHTQNLGMTLPSEVVGRKPEDFFVASRARLFHEEDLEIMRTGGAVLNREEVRLGAHGDERWFLTAKLPLSDGAGAITGLVSMSRDITAHKHVAEQLRHSQKMEAIGLLAGGVAHDFNNILTAILGYSEIILRAAAPGTTLRHDIEQIHAGGTRAAALTQQLLAFSRKQVRLPRPLNLNSVIESMESLLRRLIGENIRLETRLDPAISLVEADMHQLEQVIMNLVVNARDAISDSGVILIETSAMEAVPLPGNQEHAGDAAAAVRLAVSDDGCGIPAEIRDRIFEPFFTTKDQGKGTGLGLATTYGIVQQNGGHISVRSEVGAGATFEIFLPVLSATAPEAGETTPRSEPPGGVETVLIAEDDEAVRELTCALVEELGYNVFHAPDGQAALEIVEARRGEPFDLLLTDVVMPKLGGKALADRLAVLSPRTKVLFTSGYNEEEILRKGILAEEIAFLAKPFSTEALAHKIREVLDGGATTEPRTT